PSSLCTSHSSDRIRLSLSASASVPHSVSPPPFFFFYSSAHHRALHSFPTRRSSDLAGAAHDGDAPLPIGPSTEDRERVVTDDCLDRKSTRLNSSHGSISYAVFCLKKKNDQLHQYRVNVTRAILITPVGDEIDWSS